MVFDDGGDSSENVVYVRPVRLQEARVVSAILDDQRGVGLLEECVACYEVARLDEVDEILC